MSATPEKLANALFAHAHAKSCDAALCHIATTQTLESPLDSPLCGVPAAIDINTWFRRELGYNVRPSARSTGLYVSKFYLMNRGEV